MRTHRSAPVSAVIRWRPEPQASAARALLPVHVHERRPEQVFADVYSPPALEANRRRAHNQCVYENVQTSRRPEIAAELLCPTEEVMPRKLTTHDWIVKQTVQEYQEPIKSTEPTSQQHIIDQLTVEYVEPPKQEVSDPDAQPYVEQLSTKGLSTFDRLEKTLEREYRAPLPVQRDLFGEE